MDSAINIEAVKSVAYACVYHLTAKTIRKLSV